MAQRTFWLRTNPTDGSHNFKPPALDSRTAAPHKSGRRFVITEINYQPVVGGVDESRSTERGRRDSFELANYSPARRLPLFDPARRRPNSWETGRRALSFVFSNVDDSGQRLLDRRQL
jgi:hypothetical protein